MSSPTSPSDAYEQALQFLYGRINYERTPTIPYQERHLKLDRMRRLAELAGNPERSLTVVHIAGSKGKGSTATMLSHMLQAAGYRTGLYTSPHLQRLEERIAIDGKPCTAATLTELVQRIRPLVLKMDDEVAAAEDGAAGPTYFEIVTALALLHFAQQSVDLAVLEVGLGGRLDSTNICQPVCCAITSISHDHTRQLGDNLADIAAEKAGIVKPRVPVVSGVRGGPARAVIQRVAAAHACPLKTLGVDYDFDFDVSRRPQFYFRENGARCRELQVDQLGMLGGHQAMNASIALAVASTLEARGLPIDDAAARQGLTGASCRARVELIAKKPLVIVDAAHNRASIAALRQTLKENFPAAGRVVIFATTRGKDVRGMLELLLPAARHVLLTKYLHNPRSVDIAELLKIAEDVRAGLTGQHVASVTAAELDHVWQEALSIARPDELICVTGSFFLAAELMPIVDAWRISRSVG